MSASLCTNSFFCSPDGHLALRSDPTDAGYQPSHAPDGHCPLHLNVEICEQKQHLVDGERAFQLLNQFEPTCTALILVIFVFGIDVCIKPCTNHRILAFGACWWESHQYTHTHPHTPTHTRTHAHAHTHTHNFVPRADSMTFSRRSSFPSCVRSSVFIRFTSRSIISFSCQTEKILE